MRAIVAWWDHEDHTWMFIVRDTLSVHAAAALADEMLRAPGAPEKVSAEDRVKLIASLKNSALMTPIWGGAIDPAIAINRTGTPADILGQILESIADGGSLAGTTEHGWTPTGDTSAWLTARSGFATWQETPPPPPTLLSTLQGEQ